MSDNLIRARELYRAPNQTSEEIERVVVTARQNGDGRKMLREMLDGCARRNWYLTPIKSEWELHAYPLRQAEVRVRGGVNMPVTDLLPCLEHLAQFIAEQPASTDEQGSHRSGKFSDTEAGSPELEYDIRLRDVNNPPGFLPDTCGNRLPPCVVAEKTALQASLKTQVTVFVQGIYPSRQEAIPFRYNLVLDCLKRGAREGADCDDDNGYAFFVNSPATPLTPQSSR